MEKTVKLQITDFHDNIIQEDNIEMCDGCVLLVKVKRDQASNSELRSIYRAATEALKAEGTRILTMPDYVEIKVLKKE